MSLAILHVDDDSAVRDLFADVVEAEFEGFDVLSAPDVATALDLLESEPVDCIVSDYELPDTDGLDFFERVRTDDGDVPFILFTGKGTERTASQAISAGVTDYVLKGAGSDQYAVLMNRIEKAVEARREGWAKHRREQRFEMLAELSQDALEGTAPERLADRLVAGVTDLLETDNSKVLKLSPDGDVLDVVAGVGWGDGTVGSATVEATTESQAGYTLSVSEPVVVEDTATETRFSFPALLSDHDVRSGISIVIGPTDDPWGVFGTHARAPREFSADEVTFVKNAVNVLATAIERQRAEQRLRDSESRFREIAELSPDAIFRMSVGGGIEYVSPVVESLLGHDPDDLVGDHFASLLAPGPTQSVYEHFERVVDGEIVRGFETTLADAAGADVPVEINASPVFGPDGTVTAVQGLVRDVSDRKERAEELELKERVLTAAPIGITISDATAPDNPLVYANDSFQQLTGYGPEDILGQNCRFLQGPDTEDAAVRDLRGAVDAGESISLDILNYRQDGTAFWNHLTIAPVEDEDGFVSNFVGFQQDVTDRHQYEQVLARLHECSQEMSRAEDAAAICAIAAETTTELLEFDGTVVYSFDDETRLTPVAQSLPSVESSDLESCDAGLVWETFTDGDPVFFESVEAVDGAFPALPFTSALVVPVDTHGVIVTGTTGPTTLSATQRETANLLRESVDAALDGVEREQERRDRIDRMRQQNDQLEQLDRLNGIIRDTVRTVVQSKSGVDIWRGVCETFASAPQYTAAWVGRYDTTTGACEIEHWDGLDAEYVEYLRTNDEATPIRDMVAEVARTQTVQTARNILETDAWEPLRGHALNTGYRSVAVVPIAHAGEHATVLVIYGTEAELFEPRNEILDELGDIIGYAVQNLAGGTPPETGSHAQVEVLIRDERLFSNQLAAATESAIAISGTVLERSDTVRVFVKVTDETHDEFERAAGDLAFVRSVSLLSARNGTGLYQLSIEQSALFEILATHGCRLTDLVLEDGGTLLTLDVPGDTSVRSLVESLQGVYQELELVARRANTDALETPESLRASLVGELTEKQLSILETALFGGFYEWPRQSTSEELATAHDIASSTFQYHLRAGERKLVEAILG